PLGSETVRSRPSQGASGTVAEAVPASAHRARSTVVLVISRILQQDTGMVGVVRGSDGRKRCWWCVGAPDYERYHDEEWGRPVRDDVRLFEKLCLEGFQAGLSWLTILRKRDAFRRAFAGFVPAKVARFGARDVDRLLADAGIVRHRGKIEST